MKHRRVWVAPSESTHPETCTEQQTTCAACGCCEHCFHPCDCTDEHCGCKDGQMCVEPVVHIVEDDE